MSTPFTRFPELPEGYDPHDPWKTDKLDREKFTIPLDSFLSKTPGPFVIAIDSAWGSGKSLFLRMWADDFRHKQNKPCVLFNAWENDYADDPIIPFIDEIIAFSKSIDNHDKSIEKILSKFSKKAISLIKTAPKGIFNIGVNYAEKKGVSIKPWEDAANKKSNDSQVKTEYILSNSQLYKDYISRKKNIGEFIQLLSTLAERITDAAGGFPLIVMIDELDRCRPDYAILLLERIKHLFSVKGIIFIIAIESGQLCSTIQTLYGIKENTKTYLRKFIDLWYSLPDPDTMRFVKHLSEIYGFDNLFEKEKYDVFIEATTEIFKKSALQLRDICQIVAKLNVVIKSYKLNWVYSTLIAFYMTYDLVDHNLYKRISTSAHAYDAFHEILGSANYLPGSSRASAVFESCFAYMTSGADGLRKTLKVARDLVNHPATDSNKYVFMINNKEEIYATAPSLAKIIECVNLAALISS